MAQPLSPGVESVEIDLTTIVPSVATTEAAIAGAFQWGPVDDRELVTNEEELVLRYGQPSDGNFETWLSASSFLAYGNKLYVSRAAANTSNNAVAYVGGDGVPMQIKNETDYGVKSSSLPANSQFYAKCPGDLGDSLKVAVCDHPNAYSSFIYTNDANNLVTLSFSVGSNVAVLTVNSADSTNTSVNATADAVLAALSLGDYVVAGNSSVGTQYMKIKSKGTPAITSNATSQANIGLETRYFLSDDVEVQSDNLTSSTIQRYWEYYDVVEAAPGTSVYVEGRNANGDQSYDELHVVVTDEDGRFTGSPGTVLEVWKNLSRATDATGEQGGTIYYADVLNQGSRYVWYAHDRPGASSATAVTVSPASNSIPYSASFVGGTNNDTETNLTVSSLARAIDQFKSAEDIDVSLIICGKARGGVHGEQYANYVIDNICETRLDCIALISPDVNDTVNNPFGTEEDVVAFANAIRASSYAVVDSGHKYAYDRYNDKYRWVPLNGDVAGLIVRTDQVRDAWWSPGGFNRGQVKNIIKLSWNPNKARRDVLYSASVNPVVTFPGMGTILYGDKTHLNKPSAFDRINVRRLFIVLRKAISTAAKFSLFEFNDEFTRAQFRNLVEPYLRDVQGRRGITAYQVRCNEQNNTPEVIDRNEFIADILVKPNRAINFIKLRFVATPTGLDFAEVPTNF